uniref:Uncharacterized protein n=2 Tax=Caenorhabditis japonica TaxID=281687 RepID=A0A8R1DY84_CAEJA
MNKNENKQTVFMMPIISDDLMRKRVLCALLICLVTLFFLFLNGYGVWQFLQNYINRQEEKVRVWQRGHQSSEQDDDVIVTSTETPFIVATEEDRWATVPSTRIHIYTTPTVTTTSTSSLSTTSSATTTTVPTTITSPSTTTIRTTTTVTPPSTPPPSPTTTRIRTWTFPTRRPQPYDPSRHRYGQDRLLHQQQQHHHNHHHHHHHHNYHSSTTSTTTEAPTTTSSEPSTTTTSATTTTRIHITTPRYQSRPIATSSSFSIPDRITIPSSSSYRNPYMHKIEVTSSQIPFTSQHQHHHHHHHHHNRTHIDIHRHHLPYPQFPYPVIPQDVFPSSTTTTTTTSTTTFTSTTSPRHHHQHQHHHHHHHQQHPTTPTTTTTTTKRPTTTTSRQSELDKWGFVESVEELASDEETSSSSSTTSTTTTTTTTTTEAPVTEKLPERPRSRQPEPTKAPVKRVEREVTLVTGFLDIGRGEWDIYRRPLETYHKFMETLLTLTNNFVIFTDESSYDFVIKTRDHLGLLDKTKVYKITLNDLPLYGYVNEARKIIDDELKNDTFYRTIADLDMKTHPESISAEYNIVVNSKTHFLHNVTIENPFNSEHFVWLDAGYGHANENHFPYSYHWQPALPDGKISLIKVTPYFDAVSNYDLKKLYRKNVALLSGGFIAGDKHSIAQLHSIIHRKFIQLIYQNHVDDDQTLLTLAVNSYPHLFHIVLGDWFDAFRLFASDPEVQMG